MSSLDNPFGTGGKILLWKRKLRDFQLQLRISLWNKDKKDQHLSKHDPLTSIWSECFRGIDTYTRFPHIFQGLKPVKRWTGISYTFFLINIIFYFVSAQHVKSPSFYQVLFLRIITTLKNPCLQLKLMIIFMTSSTFCHAICTLYSPTL